MPDNTPDAPPGPTPERDPLRFFQSHQDALDAVLAAAAATPAPESDADDDLTGLEIRQYRVTRALGAGGMGRVYAAEQTHPRRLVALKFLDRAYAGSEQDRFKLEAEVLGRLAHPGIAQVFEADTVRLPSGRRHSYIAMEYLADALPITQYAEQHKLSIRERVALFAEVCDAVQHAHNKGVIHRDLKPSNILVTTLDGRPAPKVIDFGIARITDADATQHTRTGTFMGSTDYMSFEQYERPHDADTRSDVYSLGAVLYELLTGKRARALEQKSPSEIISDHKTRPPESPSAIRRELRGDLETIVLKALRHDPNERYRSAADFAQDLRRYLNREPIEAKPPTAFSRVLRWAGRHPGYTSAVVAGVLGVTLASVGAIAVVAALAYVPDRIEWAPGRASATLFSQARTELAAWPPPNWGDPSTSVVIAHIFDRPDTPSGKRLVVLGYCGNAPPFKSLRAFDPDRYTLNPERSFEEPIWESRFTEDDIPAEASSGEKHIDPASMILQDCKIADVFSDVPGEEIISLFVARDRTHTCIRIYNLSGDVLYQAWVDALINLHDWIWVPGAHLLAFGANSGEHNLVGLDRNIVGPNNDPMVVFALSPKPGVRDRRYVELYRDGLSHSESRVSAAWAKFVQPFSAAARCATPRVELRLRDGSETVHVSVSLLKGGAGAKLATSISWYLDPTGRVLEGPTAYPSQSHFDAVRALDPNLPVIANWKLEPLKLPPDLETERRR